MSISVKEKANHIHLRTTQEIQGWLCQYLSKFLELDPSEVNVNIPFERFALDSSLAIGMTGDLEDWLGKEVDPTSVYDYPTIRSLSEYLATCDTD